MHNVKIVVATRIYGCISLHLQRRRFTGCSAGALLGRYCFATLWLLVRVNPVSGRYHNEEPVAVTMLLLCMFSVGFYLHYAEANAM